MGYSLVTRSEWPFHESNHIIVLQTIGAGMKEVASEKSHASCAPFKHVDVKYDTQHCF